VRYLELGAYGVIVLFGLALAWRKGRALLAAWSARHGAHHAAITTITIIITVIVDMVMTTRTTKTASLARPEPAELKGKGWLKRGLTAVIAIGMRPCSGAILVLVFALSQGIFAIGVAATFAMALGTAITVTAIALLAVWARESRSGSPSAPPRCNAVDLWGRGRRRADDCRLRCALVYRPDGIGAFISRRIARAVFGARL